MDRISAPPGDHAHGPRQRHAIDALHTQAFALVSRLGPHAQDWVLRRWFDWWYRHPDPWRLHTREEEQQKYAKILDAVPSRRFHRVLDVGCSEGAFTELAAQRYPDAELTGIDLSVRAVARARQKRRGNVRFFAMNLLTDTPPDTYDLVFCSEMLYYLGTRDRLRDGAARLRDLLAPGGLLVASHPSSGADRLHAPLFDDPALTVWSTQVERAGELSICVAVFAREP